MPDKDFWGRECIKAVQFHKECVLPKFHGKWFSLRKAIASAASAAQDNTVVVQTHTFCVCQGDKQQMIKCDNENCALE